MKESKTDTVQNNIANRNTHQIGDELGILIFQVLTKNSAISIFKIAPTSCDFSPHS